ncbi:hypothetical protein N7497_000859 [Penicillium chrysogenum]|nr:hypothetical protein N7497_000859 [Penicillium chrysogenum]
MPEAPIDSAVKGPFPSPNSGRPTLLTSFDYLLNTSFNKGSRKQLLNYDVSLKNNKGSEKQQSAARRKNGDSNPHRIGILYRRHISV